MRLIPCNRNRIPRPALFLVAWLLPLLVSCSTLSQQGGRTDTVAVWDLEDVSPVSSSMDVGGLLSARVMEVMKGKGDYVVVERERLLRVLEELHVGSSEMADEATRLRVGRLAGARFMVMGGYQVVGDMMRIDLRLVEVNTGRTIKAVHETVSSYGGISGWLDAAGRTGGEL